MQSCRGLVALEAHADYGGAVNFYFLSRMYQPTFRPTKKCVRVELTGLIVGIHTKTNKSKNYFLP